MRKTGIRFLKLEEIINGWKKLYLARVDEYLEIVSSPLFLCNLRKNVKNVLFWVKHLTIEEEYTV